MPVQPPLLLSGAEDGILFPHVHQTGQAGHRLRGDGGDGRSRHPRLEIQDQGEVQEDVQERGQGQKIHRRFAVPQRADDGGQQVVEEGGRDAHEDDEDIGIGVVDDVRRGAHHHQNVPAEQPRGHGEHQGEQGGEIGGVGHKAAHLAIFPGPHPLGHRDGKAVAHPHAEADDEKVDGAGGAHRRQGLGPQQLAHDHGVHQIIKLLEQHAAQGGQGEG